MIVQSGGNKLYAVLAMTEQYELGLLPILSNLNQHAIVSIRCRYKDKLNPYFDAMQVPKPVLLAGIERSKNTLRGMVHCNTQIPLASLTEKSAAKMATLVRDLADGFLIGEGSPLSASDIREDFVEDFAKLLAPQIEMQAPQKIGSKPALLTAMDLDMIKQSAGDLPTPVQAATALTDETGQDTNVVKVPFGHASAGADDDDGTSDGAPKEGVDGNETDPSPSDHEPA